MEKERKYRIKSWIPVEMDDRFDGVLLTKEEAEYELQHCELMQPENKYEIVEVEE